MALVEPRPHDGEPRVARGADVGIGTVRVLAHDDGLRSVVWAGPSSPPGIDAQLVDQRETVGIEARHSSRTIGHQSELVEPEIGKHLRAEPVLSKNHAWLFGRPLDRLVQVEREVGFGVRVPGQERG